MSTFAFYRFRFHLRAAGDLRFPAGKSGNVIRGAFGMLLRDTATEADYYRLFEPRPASPGEVPSGFADLPRPFVFRAAPLENRIIPQGEAFSFDLHLFDTRTPDATLQAFRRAFEAVAHKGIGGSRALFENLEQVDLGDRAIPLGDTPAPPCVIELDPPPAAAGRIDVRFVTPTELKASGALAERPDFPILFGRLRDRLSMLRSLYGAGPLPVDFRALAETAASVRLAHCELQWQRIPRRSARTGQVHSIGGFTGTARYEGPVGEFLPWLHAARWIGVGRHTVWGQGELRVTA